MKMRETLLVGETRLSCYTCAAAVQTRRVTCPFYYFPFPSLLAWVKSQDRCRKLCVSRVSLSLPCTQWLARLCKRHEPVFLTQRHARILPHLRQLNAPVPVPSSPFSHRKTVCTRERFDTGREERRCVVLIGKRAVSVHASPRALFLPYKKQR